MDIKEVSLQAQTVE